MPADIIALERFWSHVSRAGERVDHMETQCWVWRDAKIGHYGTFTLNGRTHPAHRAFLIICGIELGDGEIVCHECYNKRCVRPSHIYVGTALSNARDYMAETGRTVDEDGRLLPMAKPIAAGRAIGRALAVPDDYDPEPDGSELLVSAGPRLVTKKERDAALLGEIVELLESGRRQVDVAKLLSWSPSRLNKYLKRNRPDMITPRKLAK